MQAFLFLYLTFFKMFYTMQRMKKSKYEKQNAWLKENSKIVALKYAGSDLLKLEKLQKIANLRGVSFSRLFKDETEKLLNDPQYKDL